MDKYTYNLLVEPSGRNYENLLDFALGECKFFLLVTAGNNKQLSPRGKEVLNQLTPFLYKMEMKLEWPGTILLRNAVPVYTYHFVQDSVEILKSSTEGLYQWQRPDLPDDLCLLRFDESPWLVTIAHESDSYFELTEEEMDRLVKALPAYASIIQISGK